MVMLCCHSLQWSPPPIPNTTGVLLCHLACAIHLFCRALVGGGGRLVVEEATDSAVLRRLLFEYCAVTPSPSSLAEAVAAVAREMYPDGVGQAQDANESWLHLLGLCQRRSEFSTLVQQTVYCQSCERETTR